MEETTTTTTKVTEEREEEENNLKVKVKVEGKDVIVPRPYQQELLEKAKAENVICVLPTGSGKTLIACMLISYIKQKEVGEKEKKKTIFLVPTRPLVAQQKKYIEVYLKKTGENYSVGSYGMNNNDILSVKEEIKEVSGIDWKLRDIYVSTPQVVLSALGHSELRMDDIDLIVFDECHHARGDHPYKLIMSEFYKSIAPGSPRPHILGLSASVVLSLNAFEEELRVLELNLDSKMAVAESFKEKKNAQIMIRTYKRDYGLDLASPSSNNWWCYSSCLTLTQRVTDGIGPWGLKVIELVGANDKPMSMWDLCTGGSVALPPLADGDMSDKALRLVEMLEEWAGGVSASQFRGIVFCKERILVVLLSVLLWKASQTRPKLEYIRLAPFMSHTSMTKSAQNDTMRRFRCNDINMIVSTGVLEEGLDVPECNVVIRYDLADTFKSTIQSKGRARSGNSVFVLFCDENDAQKETYRWELENFYGMVSSTPSLESSAVLAKQERQDLLASKAYVVEKTGAKVTIAGAKTVLSHFLNVRLGACTKDTFVYNMAEASLTIPEEAETDTKCVTLTPEELALNISWKKLLNLKLVICLHEDGDLDDNLEPVRLEKTKLIDSMLGYHSHSYGTLSSRRMAVPASLSMPWEQVSHPPSNEKSDEALYISYMYEVFVTFYGGSVDDENDDNTTTTTIPDTQLFRESSPYNDKAEAKPFNRASRMCLLTPGKLDDIVNRLEFLGRETRNKTKMHVRFLRDWPLLTREKIQLGDKFNAWAFGNCQTDVFDSFAEGCTKHYLLLPFCLSSDSVDWERVKGVIRYNEVYSREYAKSLVDGGKPIFISNPDAMVTPEALKTRGTLFYTPYTIPRGFFTSEGVLDGVTPASLMRDNWKFTKKKSGSSNNSDDIDINESNDDDDDDNNNNGTAAAAAAAGKAKADEFGGLTYAEYYMKRHHLTITDMSQKLIRSKRGDMVPELCRVFPLRKSENLVVSKAKARMWQLEFALACVDFKKNSPFANELSELSVEEVAQAFVSTSASASANYENLEFFGDTAVKFCVVTRLFLSHPNDREKGLVKRKNMLVSNRLLAGCAQSSGVALDAMVVSGRSQKEVSWAPPSAVSGNGSGGGGNPATRTLGLKMVADVFEALTGLSALAPLSCSDDNDSSDSAWCNGLFFSTWDKARRHLYQAGLHEVGTYNQMQRDMERIISKKYSLADQFDLMDKASIKEAELAAAEKGLHYKFRNRALLCEALIHESCSIGRGYQRLEFLGDAVIDAVVTLYLVRRYPNMSPYVYSEMRRSVVQNTSLAWVVVANKLHPLLHFRNKEIMTTLEKYVLALTKHGYADPAHPPPSPWEDLGSPKTFGDLFEALVGAIYLDTRGDMTAVNEIIFPFLEPLMSRITDPRNPDISPTSRMAQQLQVLDFGNKVSAKKSVCKNGDIRVDIFLKKEDEDKSGGDDDDNDDSSDDGSNNNNNNKYVFRVFGVSSTLQMAQFNAAKEVLKWFDENKEFVNKHTRK